MAHGQELGGGLVPAFLAGKSPLASAPFSSFLGESASRVDPYLFCVLLSFAGLLIMAVAGVGHRGHHHHGAHARSAGRGHQQQSSGNSLSRGAWFLFGLFSPRVLFSVLMGFGVLGSVLDTLTPLPTFAVIMLAVVGGVAFERFVVGPFWNMLIGFASKPARTLETTLFTAGEAATDFDRTGHGLVRLELDGQVRQVLAALAPEERAADSPRIRTGERLFIRSVDRRRNVCTVSRLGC